MTTYQQYNRITCNDRTRSWVIDHVDPDQECELRHKQTDAKIRMDARSYALQRSKNKKEVKVKSVIKE